MVVEVESWPRRSFVVVSVSVLLDVAGSLTIVVFDSLFSVGGLLTVVSFFSQAASNAAPAKMQMILFIL